MHMIYSSQVIQNLYIQLNYLNTSILISTASSYFVIQSSHGVFDSFGRAVRDGVFKVFEL